ncbi:hypothetical protein IKG05_01965 [Candidatus Saccharibacteria bacterium]|nr:hypothetical protein [Candidatus Saccharibacteria bacterium]
MDNSKREFKAKTKTVNKIDGKTGDSLKKKKIFSISALVIGLIMLVVGVVFLVINLIGASKTADGEYLIDAGQWALEGEEGVVWDFTEVGKGVLTTNNHLNDYDFIWAIEDGKLLIETDWLYDLENEFAYELNHGTGELFLTANGEKYVFKVLQE